MLGKAKDINQPPNFAVKTTTRAEVTQFIFLIFSREEPTETTSPPVTRTIVIIIAIKATNHEPQKPPFVPGAVKVKDGTQPHDVVTELCKIPGH